jgi:carboxylesterase type B
VGPDTLVEWYADRIASEGRWRTFARISSDSGHACSSTLHGEALALTSDNVYRYFFAYAAPGHFAMHGGDESWLLVERENGTPQEVALSHDMAMWWASLNAHGDPNVGANKGAPMWTRCV